MFSQWDKMLAIVHTALEHNRVRCVRLGAKGPSGSRRVQDAVQTFSATDGVRVLLLPTKRAGRGLNILAANHVFLVEPLITPDLELQAVGACARCVCMCV